MPAASLDVVPAAMKRSFAMSRTRLCVVFAHLVLILISSTPAAGEAAHYAYKFYLGLFGLLGTSPGLRTLAQKGLHFALFFSLGTWLYHGLSGSRLQRFCWTVGICVLAGTGSEAFQLLFPVRQAALADVLLNAASGTLAAVLGARSSPSAGVSFNAGLGE